MNAPQFQFAKVNRIGREYWHDAEPTRTGAVPGTIYLLGRWGQTGGLLRVTRQGFLLLLTREQVFCEATIYWPISGAQMKIQGDVLTAVSV